MKTVLFVALTFSLNAFAQANVSSYTSVAQANCRVTESSEWQKQPEIDYLTMICPGVAGYKVKISGGDLRYPLSLISGGREVKLTDITAFHELGSTNIEWRGPAGQAPTALIYRMQIANEEGRMSPYLYVVRLNGRHSCVIGRILPGTDMNERARFLADDVGARCAR